MKIFLTGATGFVGSVLLQRFVADGVELTALVRNDSVCVPDRVEKVVGDLGALAEAYSTDNSPSPPTPSHQGRGA